MASFKKYVEYQQKEYAENVMKRIKEIENEIPSEVDPSTQAKLRELLEGYYSELEKYTVSSDISSSETNQRAYFESKTSAVIAESEIGAVIADEILDTPSKSSSWGDILLQIPEQSDQGSSAYSINFSLDPIFTPSELGEDEQISASQSGARSINRIFSVHKALSSGVKLSIPVGLTIIGFVLGGTGLLLAGTGTSLIAMVLARDFDL